MKKLIFLMCTLFLFALPCNADSGDIVGKIYSTDILAYVNDVPVVGYNIGGRTAVIVEDMSKIPGISYSYNDEERLLTVSAAWYKNYISTYAPEIERGKPGKTMGTVYETDIKVILNGSEVRGYNIGGKTAVLIEDIGTVTENPNEDYGFSKYLCNFNWNAEERIVTLDFVGGYVVDYGTNPMAISIPSICFTAKNNVWIADYNPLNEFFSKVYNSEYTEEYIAEKYVLRPLYFEVDGERYEVGLCYTGDRDYDKSFIKSPELAYDILKQLVPEPTPSDEALNLLSDGENYEMLDSIETEDFYFLVVLDKLKEAEPYNQIYYVAVKKTGGYAKISESSTNYTTRILKKTGINKIYVTVSPFAGPHGATSMGMEFDLNNYIFWQ